MDDIQSWWEVPSIAHFCSLFRAAFNLLDFDIEELEEALLTDGAEDSGSSLLQELMVRLLAGCVPSAQGCISIFNYQMFLRRIFRQKCQEYGRDNPFNTDMDFQFLPLRSKVEILHALCDFRLDADDVQDLLKNLESDSLRVEPLGHDESNSAYWYFYGTRLYREDYPRIKKGVQERKRKVRDDKRKRTRRKKKKGAATAEEEEDEEEVASDGEEEDACLKSRTGAGVRWQVVCFSEGDWEALTERLHGSTSPPERALHRTLAEDFLPEIPRLFAEKERLQRKRMQESQPRRTSGRIEKLRKQQQREAAVLEEEERSMGRGHAVGRINEDSMGEIENERIIGSGGDDDDDVEEQDNKMVSKEEERDRLFQCYLAREERVTRAFLRSLSTVQGESIILGSNLRDESSSESSFEDVSESRRRKSPRVKRRDKHKGRGRGATGGNRSEGSRDGLPVGRQTNNSLSSATGPIIIQTSRRKLKSSQVFRQSDEDLQTGLHKILERVKSHEDAWPFADPVDEEWAPRYYAVVRKPMHLRRMEEKLEAGEYLSFSHFKADFMLIVDNCRKYNGSENEYTEMVENLREVFQRAADRYLESDLSSDEDVAVEFPPPAGAVPGSLPGAEGGAVGGEESPPPRVKKEEAEEVVEKEEQLPAKDELSEGRRRRKRLRGGDAWKEGDGKRRAEEEIPNEEESTKEEKDFGKERDAERKEERREEKRRQEKRKEERKEERKRDEKRKEEERKREEELDMEKEKRGKVDKETKSKSEEVEGREVEEREKGKVDERREEAEEERFGSHRKRRKKLSEDDGNERKRKGQSGRERARRVVEAEEEAPEEKKVSQESIPPIEDDDDEGNTSGSRKKDSLPSNKKNKSKPKKQPGVVRNAAAIDALAEATEQTLKDINKWLDDTPRFSEFSSASNSPSHLMSAEEFDSVGKGIESEYRRSLRMCDPSLGDFSQKEHSKKETGPVSDKKGVRVDKRKLGQGSGVAGTVPGPKRTIIERLQPGKSKGNLLKQGRSSSEADSSAGGAGVIGVGSITDEPSKKPGEATPKLSLGSVLRGDIAFGEVAKKETEEGADEEEEEILQVGGNAKKEKKEEEVKVEVIEKFEEEKCVRKKIGSATPNLSAWFKAFGAPRGQGQRKKGPEEGKVGIPQDEVEKTNLADDAKLATEEARKVLPDDDVGTVGKVDPEPPLSPSPSGTPLSNSGRQRHVSTGSSNVSDLSSAFSPDVVDPALSPRLVELPSHSPSASIAPPLPSPFSPVNGTIRVGFYQDTSQKSVGSVGSNGGVEEGLPSPTHTGSSSLSLPQSSVPMQSSDMQFYDTSKPLTDQYREVAARVHHQQQPPSAPSPPPVSPSPPPPPPLSPPRPLPYPTTTPSVIFSTSSSGVSSPTYPSPIVYPPPTSTAVTSYAPSTSTTTTSFPMSDCGSTTSFPVKKRLYASATVSSTASTPLTEGVGPSVLVAPTCSSPVGRSYHSPEPQVALVQRTAALVLPASPPPYVCSSQGNVPGYPHAHLQAPQSKPGFQRLPIYHHHPELTQLHPQHPEKPEPLRTVLHHPPHSHPSHSPHTSEVQPNSPARPVDPLIVYRDVVEHQRRVLDLTGSASTIQPASAPTRTKTKTSRKTKAVRQQQQRQDQPSETHTGPVTTSGFQQFRKSPEPMATGLQQPQHPPSGAYEFAASLTLYGRDEKDFQHHYLRAPTLPPRSTGYYVDPGSMVKSPPPPPHQQPQQQHSQPLPQGCPPQATVGSALPSYPFPISPHYPHYHHPHHHHHLEAVPPTKSQYLPASPPTPSSTTSPTTVPSPSPTTSASPMAAPSIPSSLLSSAPPSFHPPSLSPLPPALPTHRSFCSSGNGRPSGSGILTFQQGQQREGGRGSSIVAGGTPFAVDAAHTNPLYQQYHHHAHAHHLHPPPHHIPQEELLLRGAAPPLAPSYPSGYQHAFDAINRPPWL